MRDYPIVWIIIGVAGSGKTRIGRLLAEKLECDFLEGDRRHPPQNIAKMLAQTPLTDGDRAEWLEAMVADIQRGIDCHHEAVVSCSALKRAYREKLRVNDRVQLVWLDVSTAELARRLAARTHHYMQPEMLSSQIEAFEPIASPEDVMIVDGLPAPAAIVDAILAQGRSRFRDGDRVWWERGGVV